MKKSVLALFLISFSLYSCAGTKYAYSKEGRFENHPNKGKTTKATDIDKEVFEYSATDVINELVVATAIDNIGVRYKYGGLGDNGFDCSGLVYTSFKKFDVKLPRSSSEMAQIGEKIAQEEAKRGDLIFFKTNGSKRINHVGIVTEVADDEIKFVHSSTKLGVIISSTKEAYYKKSFVKVMRLSEPVGQAIEY